MQTILREKLLILSCKLENPITAVEKGGICNKMNERLQN